MQVTKKTPKNYIPLGSRMLCRRVTETKVSTVIHTLESTQNKSLLFEVLAKGPDCVDDGIKVGDYVYTGQFAPCPLDFPGHDDWCSLNEVDALGAVTEFDIEKGQIRGAA